MFPLLHKIRYTAAGLTLCELERILGIEPGDVFRCSVHLISRQVVWPPPQSELRKRNALCVLITELQANGSGRQVTRPPPQSELLKRKTLSVLTTELHANGNGRQVTSPPQQSELQKQNALSVLIIEVSANRNVRWEWQSSHGVRCKVSCRSETPYICS